MSSNCFWKMSSKIEKVQEPYQLLQDIPCHRHHWHRAWHTYCSCGSKEALGMHGLLSVQILSFSCSFRGKFCKIIGLCTPRSWRPLWEILDQLLHWAKVRLSGLHYVILLICITHRRCEEQRRSWTFTFLLLIHHILAPVPSAGKTAIKLHNRSVYDMYHRQIVPRDQGSVICLSLIQISMDDLLF